MDIRPLNEVICGGCNGHCEEGEKCPYSSEELAKDSNIIDEVHKNAPLSKEIIERVLKKLYYANFYICESDYSNQYFLTQASDEQIAEDLREDK